MARKKPIAAGRNPRERGSNRMAEMGYRKVDVWLDPQEFKAIDRAARKDGKRLATWIRQMCFLIAQDKDYKKP